jgi:hypothetical protein
MSVTRSRTTPRTQRNLVTATAWFVLAFVALIAFWVLKVRPSYVEPEYAELVNTTRMYHPHLADFFLGPVNRYSITYSEWTRLSRDLIRPVVAFNYYLWSHLFGSNFAAYLVGTYLCMAALCGMTFYIAAELLELPLALSHLVASLVFLSPAFGEQELFQATFAPDPLAAFWILAASLLFLRRNYLTSWLCIALAVGAKETAWPVSIGMAILFLCFADRSRPKRILGSLAFLLPLTIMLCLRVHAFGMRGIVKGDQADSTIHSTPALVAAHVHSGPHWLAALSSGPIAALALRLIRWPFGILLDSFQYDDRLLRPFTWLGILFNICFWLLAAGFTIAVLVRRRKSRHASTRQQTLKSIRTSPAPQDRRLALRITLAWLTLSGLFFLLRFGSPPRYAAATYPLMFLCAATVVASTAASWQRAIAWVFLLGVGLNGLTLRLSDMTHGVYVYRSLGQLEQSFLTAIQSAPGAPIFLVDDVAGGENNTEAFRRAFGPRVNVIRVNDLATSCFPMPDNGPTPIALTLDATREAAHTLRLHSSVAGCGGHEFFEVPGLPDGPITRSSGGYTFTYDLTPRANPQPTSGPPREMTVTIEGVPANAVLLAPDFSRHAYVSIPIH